MPDQIKKVIEACQAAAASTDATAYYNAQWWEGAAVLGAFALVVAAITAMVVS